MCVRVRACVLCVHAWAAAALLPTHCMSASRRVLLMKHHTHTHTHTHTRARTQTRTGFFLVHFLLVLVDAQVTRSERSCVCVCVRVHMCMCMRMCARARARACELSCRKMGACETLVPSLNSQPAVALCACAHAGWACAALFPDARTRARAHARTRTELFERFVSDELVKHVRFPFL